MYKTVQNCQYCGANLSLDDMRQTNCPYCGTVYPHHSQAQQHAQVVNQVMGNMMQQQGGFGAPPQPGFGMPPGQPGSPFGDHNQLVQAHMAQAQRSTNRMMIIVMAVVLGMFLIGGLVALLTVGL
jgi:hypothetical protein